MPPGPSRRRLGDGSSAGSCERTRTTGYSVAAAVAVSSGQVSSVYMADASMHTIIDSDFRDTDEQSNTRS